MKPFWKHSKLAAVALLAVLAACSSDDYDLNAGEPPAKKDIALTESQRQMRDNNNDFACNLFRTINEQKSGDGSIVVSPISVSYVLGMLNEGADGSTRQQITDVLGLGNSVQEINEYFKKMIEGAPYVDQNVTVRIANCINVNSAMGISLIPQFQTDMEKYYCAQVDALDFTLDSSLSHINNWCNTHTDGMIPEILRKDEFQADALMYLLNAVYFKAPWTEKFDPNDTRDRDFTKQDGTIVKRPTMYLKTTASVGMDDMCRILCLPYGSNGYSMYVLLPNEGYTIDDIIEGLSAEKLEEQSISLSSREVNILLPRFTTSNETKLEDILSSMGMPLAFSRAAEFPNMAQRINDMYVSKMKQKAKIEVSEEGTKAAAVTVAVMTRNGSGFGFYATRPFVYYIMEESTRSIFFMGTYCGD